MNIEKLDKNFIVNTEITEPDIVWLDAKSDVFELTGVKHNGERYTRFPENTAKSVSEAVFYLNRNTSGGRLRFRTDSSFIAIHSVTAESCPPMPHFSITGQAGFDIYSRTNPDETPVYHGTFIPPIALNGGYTSSRVLSGEMREYTINFPTYDNVDELYIALKEGATLLPPFEQKNPLPVVYYGSSITQGGCTSRPGNTYPAILSRELDTNFINLGFSGSGRAEPEIAEYIASLEMSVFVCDYDYNAPDPEYLEKTHYPLYRTVRDAQPELPIIFMSAPNFYADPANHAARREIIRATYLCAQKDGDENVYFIDGEELFGSDNRDACTVDTCHPNDLGFYRMAKRVKQTLAPLLK